MGWISEAIRRTNSGRLSGDRGARARRPALEAMEGRLVLSTMVPTSEGVAGIAGGALWWYQDNAGWVDAGGIGVKSVVASHNALGQDELFAKLADNAVWSYTPATRAWQFTGGHFDLMVPAVDGVTGTAGGGLYHFQDDGGWSNPGGAGIVSILDTRNPYNQDEVFATLRDGSLWSVNTGLGLWHNTGGHLDGMIATANGVSGTLGGSVFHYQDNGGWSHTGAVGVVALADSRNAFGQEELFARLYDGQIWSNTAGAWKNTGGHLDGMIGTVNGVSGTLGGHLWHYQDNGGWLDTGGERIAAALDAHDPANLEEAFVQVADGSVWSYTPGAHSWYNTKAYLD